MRAERGADVHRRERDEDARQREEAHQRDRVGGGRQRQVGGQRRDDRAGEQHAAEHDVGRERGTAAIASSATTDSLLNSLCSMR